MVDPTPSPANTKPADQFANGIYGRFWTSRGGTGGAMLDYGQWIHAIETGQEVGTCRFCGHEIWPNAPYQAGAITWYEAECRFCGRIVASPNQEILRRSSRHSEMPRGFWEGRTGKSDL